MEPQMAYVQITHVVPYFDDEELAERTTEFERNHNINRFMYEIPFTTDGRVRGNPEDQCKRRIILTSKSTFMKETLAIVSFFPVFFSFPHSSVQFSLSEEAIAGRSPRDVRPVAN